MVRIRISIAGMAALIALVGLGLAALRQASGYWASAMVTATIGLLLTSVLGALRGRNSSAWLGFAVFGWAYFAIGVGPWFQEDLRPHLLTSVAIVEAFEALHASDGNTPRVEARFAYPNGFRPPTTSNASSAGLLGPRTWVDIPPRFAVVEGFGPAPIVPGGSGQRVAWQAPYFPAFERSAHCLFSVFAGLVGAGIGSSFSGRTESSPPRPGGE